jgi:chitinase
MTSSTGSSNGPGGNNGSGVYDRVGYFAQWGIYGRKFYVKNVADTQADKLTIVNYAFGNIDPVNLTCLMTTKPSDAGNEMDPSAGDGAGDQWADYGKGFTGDISVDGQADTWDQKLKGNFNQLKKLKAKFPNIKVVISLGGWTFSKYFSDAAASDGSRKKFVSSCIDMYIKGNIPPYDGGTGGPGTAAGIFDGIDIDWEWPGSNSGHLGNHSSPNDKQNFGLLMKEFRSQLDALGGQHYLLTAFMPADPAKIAAGIDIPTMFGALDIGNVQGYDFHGAWETTTNHQGVLFDPAGDPAPANAKFSGDAAISAYLSAGVSADKLTLGLPLYGRGWTGVADGGNGGLFQPASGPAQATYQAGTEDFKVLTQKFPNPKHDDNAVAAWGYDGSNFWTFDDAWAFQKKAAYIKSKKLRGAMVWELDGDDGTLLNALDSGLK